MFHAQDFHEQKKEKPMIGATLFVWLQGAGFYRELHQQAVESLPRGEGRTWLDVGCGPGLVARQAAARGYETIGVDAGGHMIRAAKRLARWHRSEAIFQKGDLASLAGQQADVVSAASLLAVLDDKPAGVAALWRSVLPGGHLLLIEPTPAMNRANAERLICAGTLPRKRQCGIKLWAAAREGRTVEPAIFTPTDAVQMQHAELLDGLVGVWIFRKPNSRVGWGEARTSTGS